MFELKGENTSKMMSSIGSFQNKNRRYIFNHALSMNSIEGPGTHDIHV